MLEDFTKQQLYEMWKANLTWFGFGEYEIGEEINVKFGETYMRQLKLYEWIPLYLPLAYRELNQELPYPIEPISLGEIIYEHMEFGETVNWMVIGAYHRLDNHNDELLNMQIGTSVDWLKIEILPKTIVNHSSFALFLTLTKTKSLMKMLEKEERFAWIPKVNGKARRTY